MDTFSIYANRTSVLKQEVQIALLAFSPTYIVVRTSGAAPETARANGLNIYYYIKYLLTELPKLISENGNIEQSELESLMPWSKELPTDCYSKRR